MQATDKEKGAEMIRVFVFLGLALMAGDAMAAKAIQHTLDVGPASVTDAVSAETAPDVFWKISQYRRLQGQLFTTDEIVVRVSSHCGPADAYCVDLINQETNAPLVFHLRDGMKVTHIPADNLASYEGKKPGSLCEWRATTKTGNIYKTGFFGGDCASFFVYMDVATYSEHTSYHYEPVPFRPAHRSLYDVDTFSPGNMPFTLQAVTQAEYQAFLASNAQELRTGRAGAEACRQRLAGGTD